MLSENPFGMRSPRRLPRLLTLLAVGLCRGVDGAESVGHAPTAMLDLPQDGYLAGTLLDVPSDASAARTTVLWQSPDFVGPFEFGLAAVSGIRFPRSPGCPPPRPVGPWRLELVSGDRLVGGIESIDAQRVVATIGSAASPSTVSVRRDAVVGMFRDPDAQSCAIPAGLAGWRQVPAASWRDDANRLTNAASPAILSRDFPVGPRTAYDISLSWRERPTLRLGIGRGTADVAQCAYRLELGPEGMVAVRDELEAAGTEGRADLEVFGSLPEKGLTLTVFVDRHAGRLAVMMPGVRGPVADLTIPPARESSEEGFFLSVVSGVVSLDGLLVSPWIGGSLVVGEDRQGAIRLRQGGTLASTVREMKQGSGMLLTQPVVGPASGESMPISLDIVDEILFPSNSAAMTSDVPSDVPACLLATDLWGTRLAGKLIRVEQGIVWLAHPAIESPVPLPQQTLVSLSTVGWPEAGGELPGKRGRLVCDQGSCWGCLVGGDSAGGDGLAGRSAIAWQPAGSLSARPLAWTPDGGPPRAVITYAEPVDPGDVTGSASGVGGIGAHIGLVAGRPAVVGLVAGSAARKAGVEPGEVIIAIAPRGDGRFVDTGDLSLEDAQHLLRGRVGSRVQLRLQGRDLEQPRDVAMVRQPLTQLGRSVQSLEQALKAHDRLTPRQEPLRVEGHAGTTPIDSLLILRTGETVACLVNAIDARGVHVRLPEGDPVTVTADLVQAVELVPQPGRTMTLEKFRSLTTLPRSQRQQPPTHVVRSLHGDYLRGRLVSLDENDVRIMVEADPRGEPLALPRGDVARLIWLHPESIDAPWAPPRPRETGGLLVESIAGKNMRLRMIATGIERDTLVGVSPLVGACRIDLNRTDRLDLGTEVDQVPRQKPYSQWRLEPASEPRNRKLPQRVDDKTSSP